MCGTYIESYAGEASMALRFLFNKYCQQNYN